MLIKEYRICLPLTVEEYRIAQLYMIQKKSREESTGRDSGVEIIKNEPYENGPGGSGQYTLKIYHVGSHLPSWLRSILPPSALRVEEEAWNAYPYTRTIYRVPFVDKLTLDIETRYFDDAGEQDDVFELSKEEKEGRVVDYIDIVQDSIPRADYKAEEDPTLYVSEATGRGPLTEDWRDEFSRAQTVTHEAYTNRPTRTPDNQTSEGQPLAPLPKRIMCAYKLCRVEFRYWGMQRKVEQFIHDSALRKTMVGAHRQVWTWQDEWYGLTIDEIRRLEEETAKALANKMSDPDATGAQEDTNATTEREGSKDDSMAMLLSSGMQQEMSEAMLLSKQRSISAHEAAYDSEDERDVWRTFKKLESIGQDNLDYEPYAVDDDAISFVSCRSYFTGPTPFMSASPSSMDGLEPRVDAEDGYPQFSAHRNPHTNRPLSTDPVDKLILIQVVHGGCLLDVSNDLSAKMSDVDSLKRTIDAVVANHYPVLKDRIAIRLVQCPSGLQEAFQSLAKLKPSPIDPSMPIEMQLARDVLPLGCIPLFLTALPNYSQMLSELADRLNTSYADFLRSPDGAGFHGSVCLIGDSVGAILTHDLLNIVAWHARNDDTDQLGLSVIDAGARRWREPVDFPGGSPPRRCNSDETLSETPVDSIPDTNSREPDLATTQSPTIKCPLDFAVHTFIMLGSPVGLLLSYRQLSQPLTIGDNASSRTRSELSCLELAAEQVCNLFHPTDPYGFRVEPLLHSRFQQISPIYIPQYSNYPLGDGQPTSLVETLVRQARLFSPPPPPTVIAAAGGSHPDGSRQSSQTVNTLSSGEKSWEKAALVAFESLKEVRQHWWGQHRIDYSVHCPDSVQAVQAHSRPSIFHASYWESRDVAAFVLRQLLNLLDLNLPEASYAVDMDDEVAVKEMVKLSRSPMNGGGIGEHERFGVGGSEGGLRPIRASSASGESGPISSRFRLRRPVYENSRIVKSNHRANDHIILEGAPQIIHARFIFGLFDILSMSNEKVVIHSRPYCGPLSILGTDITDSSGRIHFHIPDQRRFPIGIHPLLITAECDREHPIQVTMAIVPPKTEAVIFSVDGSFAASVSILGKDPKVRAGAIDVARHWHNLGYLLIYLSARPDMQQRRMNSWMASHNFPPGMSLFNEGIFTDPLRQKGQLLRQICEQTQLNLHCAYGSGKDVTLYRSFGIPTKHIFSVGRTSRNQASQCSPLTHGYATHLSSLLAGHAASRPANGTIGATIRCTSFDSSAFRSPLSPTAVASPHSFHRSSMRAVAPAPSGLA